MLSHSNTNPRYEEEHIPMLREVPGWMSTVRARQMLASGAVATPLPKYAALHRYALDNGCGTSQEWKAATETPWANSMRSVVVKEGSRARSQWKYVETH